MGTVADDIRVLSAHRQCGDHGQRLMEHLLKHAKDGLVLAEWVGAFNRDLKRDDVRWGPSAWECLSKHRLIEMVGDDVRVLPPSP